MPAESSAQHLNTALFEAIIASTRDAIISKTLDGIVTSWNAAAEQLFGYSAAEMLGQPITRIFPPGHAAEAQRILQQIAAGQPMQHFETIRLHRNGRQIPVSITIAPLHDSAGQVIGASKIVRDMGPELQYRKRVERLNAFYQFLHNVNNAIFGNHDPHAILQAVCASAVQDGKFLLAWGGIPDQASGRLQPVCAYGPARAYVEDLVITLDPQLATSQGPSRLCMVQGDIVYSDHFATDQRTSPWHAAARAHGFQASASVPVMVDGVPVASFTFYSDEPQHFELELRNLLTEMARNVALAWQASVSRGEREQAESARFQTEERFRLLFQNSLDAVLQNRPVGPVISANPAACQMFRMEPQQLLGRNIRSLVDLDDPRLAPLLRQRDASGSAVGALRLRRGDGSLFEAEVSTSTYTDTQHEVMNSLIIRDITERLHAQEMLRASESRLAGIISTAMDAIISIDAGQHIVLFNAAAEAMFGYTAAEVQGQPLDLLIPPRFRAAHQQHVERFGATAHSSRSMGSQLALAALHADGHEFPIEASISQTGSAGQRTYTVILRDITARQAAQQALNQAVQQLEQSNTKLARIAHYDALTGLPNRILLAQRLEQALSQRRAGQQPLALAFLDLDGFKAVNDRYRHETGDALLVALARRIEALLGADDVLARIGGDEFVLLLGQCVSVAEVEALLHKVLYSIARPVQLDQVELRITASIGVTLLPDDDSSPDQLIRHADHAMYQAKQAGKNQFCYFDTARDAAFAAQRSMLESLHAALQQQQLVLYYQPKVNMRTGEASHVEALIRWQHPALGLLAPGQFLPAVADQPLSVELGMWVIGTALRQIRLWQQQGLRLSVSVNVSGYELQYGDFPARLRSLLAAEPEVAPQQLELEILESSALDDIEQISAIMAACQSSGVSFALDDFGTGYSSLTYLRRLPAQCLKIDQSFVFGMLENSNDRAIVQGIISLAQAFQRDVVAEGVETLEIGNALLRMGCVFAQGYGIARPMPAQAYTQWLANWQPPHSWQQIAPQLL